MVWQPEKSGWFNQACTLVNHALTRLLAHGNSIHSVTTKKKSSCRVREFLTLFKRQQIKFVFISSIFAAFITKIFWFENSCNFGLGQLTVFLKKYILFYCQPSYIEHNLVITIYITYLRQTGTQQALMSFFFKIPQ